MSGHRRRRPPLFQLDPRERGRELSPWGLWSGAVMALLAAFFLLWLLLSSLGGLALPLAALGPDGLHLVVALIAGGLLFAALLFADF